MLEGLLVDLVPFGEAFRKNEPRWINSEAMFWGTAGDRPLHSKAAIERWHAERAEREARTGSAMVLLGIRTKSGVPLGDIELDELLPHHRLAMIGIGINEPDYWGGGYGTDALLLIMEYAFNWLDFRKLWLSTMGINIRMQRAALKVGFHEEVRRRRLWLADGQWTDDVMYGMLREEWPGREAMVERLGLRAREDA